MSRILIQIEIEMGDYNTAAAAPALYTPVTPREDTPEEAMRTIIAQWDPIRGQDVKARKVTVS